MASVVGAKQILPLTHEFCESHVPLLNYFPTDSLPREVYSALVVGTAVWVAGIWASRSTLLVLMRYKVCCDFNIITYATTG